MQTASGFFRTELSTKRQQHTTTADVHAGIREGRLTNWSQDGDVSGLSRSKVIIAVTRTLFWRWYPDHLRIEKLNKLSSVAS